MTNEAVVAVIVIIVIAAGVSAYEMRGRILASREVRHLRGVLADEREVGRGEQRARITAEASLREKSEANEALSGELEAVRAELAEARAIVPAPVYDAVTLAALKEGTCTHCGGIHAIACPRIKRMRFRPDQTPVEVEFWPDDAWPKERVIWPEDLPAEPTVEG